MMTKLMRLTREYRSLFVFLCLMLVFRSAVADWMVVPSGSMNPTLMEGDYILVQKLHYGLRVPFTAVRLTEGENPLRGEIAVFTSPANGKALVKRVIGVPGDRVSMQDERLFINGVAADYAPTGPELDTVFEDAMLKEWSASNHRVERERLDGLDHFMMVQPDKPAFRSFDEVVVPAGEYLMLGDNRDNSADSRYIGLIPRGAFLGRATRVVASFNPDRYLLPRGERTLAPLR